MFLFLVILTVFNAFIVGINSADSVPYNYDLKDGISNPPWPPACTTSESSPINIIDADVKEFTYPDKLNIEMHSVKPESITAKRELYRIDFRLKYPNNQQPSLSGGPLGNETFLLEQLHFHWVDNSAGSEHAINSKKYATEAHLVYYNSKYGTFKRALNTTNNDAFAVIGVLVEPINDDTKKDSEIGKMVKKFKELKPELKDGSTSEYKDFVIYPDENKNIPKISDIVQNKSFSYYEYKGAFTYPPCKVVKWIIPTETLKLHYKDIEEITSMKVGTDDKHIITNSRPLQDLNNRTVHLILNV
ncbi:unnamed protein product [Diamesa hyperborea]